MLNWLWQDKTKPGEIPGYLYRFLVVEMKEDPDFISRLKCVQQSGLVGGTQVNLIRIYDPLQFKNTVSISDFASLDEYAELIIFEGYIDIERQTIHLTQQKH